MKFIYLQLAQSTKYPIRLELTIRDLKDRFTGHYKMMSPFCRLGFVAETEIHLICACALYIAINLILVLRNQAMSL